MKLHSCGKIGKEKNIVTQSNWQRISVFSMNNVRRVLLYCNNATCISGILIKVSQNYLLKVEFL